MKMHERERSVVYGNVTLEDLELFSVEADPIAFEILSSGLYTHKIRAVVRELSTNAFDENFKVAFDSLVRQLPQRDQDRIAAIRSQCVPILKVHQLQRSKEQRKELRRLFAQAAEIEPSYEDVLAVCKPIEVHLPNSNEPWYAVQDQGRGMEDQFARKIFTTYFKSDKRDTNNLNGCFGLGSKSPFCYTDQFTVTSIYNGWKRVYTFLVTELMVPGCLPMGEPEQTDEPNGVTVQLPVEEKDFYEFAQEAENIYRWFAVRPNVWGSSDFEWPEEDEFLFVGDNYKVYADKKDRYGYKKTYGTHVVMANVAYPVREDNFSDEVKKQFTEAELRLLKHGVILQVGTGDVKMAASREALQMVDLTVDTIKERLTEVAERIVQDVQDKLDGAANLWEARMLHHEITHESVIGTIARKAKRVYTYNGERIESKIYTFKEEVVLDGEDKDHQEVRDQITEQYADQNPKAEDLKAWQEDAVQRCFAHKKTTTFVTAEWCSLEQGRRKRRGYGYAHTFAHSKATEMVPSQNLKIIIDDLDGKGAYVRVKKYLEDNSLNGVFLVNEFPGYSLDQWLQETGLIHTNPIYVSTLDAPERVTSSRGGSGTVKKTAKAVLCTGLFSWDAERETWQDAEVDMDDGGVYVEVHRYRWSAGNLTKNRGEDSDHHEESMDFCTPRDLQEFWNVARNLEPLLELYGLRKALANRAASNPNWIRLDQWLNAKYQELSYLAEEYKKHVAYKAVSVHRKGELVKMFKDEQFASDSPFGTLVADLHAWQQLGDLPNMQAFQNLYDVCQSRLKLELPTTKDYTSAVKDLEARAGKMYEFYPMMSLVEWHRVEYSGQEQSKLADYIRLADQTRALEHVLAQAGLGGSAKADLKIA